MQKPAAPAQPATPPLPSQPGARDDDPAHAPGSRSGEGTASVWREVDRDARRTPVPAPATGPGPASADPGDLG